MLAVSYIGQYTNILVILDVTSSAEIQFIANRITRILLNDVGMICVIYAIFLDKQVIKLAVIVQILDLFILLPLYLAIKLPTEGVSELSSPFLSQFHRIIVNPILMILLIPAIFYQRLIQKT
jgi:exosortase F-associated protein